MPFKAATAQTEVEYAFDLAEECRRGSSVFMRTVRGEVTEQETQDHGHPVEVDIWLMDGPYKGTFQESMWIFPSGMRNKIDRTAGAHSAGRLEIYKSRGRDCLGLTELSPEQYQAAEKMDAYLTAHPGYKPAPQAASAPAPAPAPAATPAPVATPAPPAPAPAPAPAPQPAMAGAPAGNGTAAYPEEPPFLHGFADGRPRGEFRMPV